MKMVTKSSRHAMVETTCEWCGASFMARKQRLDKGQSRFCSRKHYYAYLKENPIESEVEGKENARMYFDKSGQKYFVQWRENGKLKGTSWSSWAWEMNFGEVPEGYRVGYKDGNPLNATLDNLYLQSYEEWGKIVADQMRGVKVMPESAKKKISKLHKGKPLSEEHKKKISLSLYKRWDSGEFEDIHVGENHRFWKGGTKPYPREYYQIRSFIKSRDNNTCQICGKNCYRSKHAHVHHIDGDKNNNDQNNLILLCSTCHTKVHHPTENTPPPILAFSSMLKY